MSSAPAPSPHSPATDLTAAMFIAGERITGAGAEVRRLAALKSEPAS
ncbi:MULTISPECIES: hypothetical protein [unclassified Streptomyces]